VVDRTGIDGTWDVVLERTLTDPMTVAVINYSESAIDSYSSALGRLGLKLERTRAAVEQLIVDHVDRIPTEN
jgi:uncharacterized protein (TIGR03435 family)